MGPKVALRVTVPVTQFSRLPPRWPALPRNASSSFIRIIPFEIDSPDRISAVAFKPNIFTSWHRTLKRKVRDTENRSRPQHKDNTTRITAMRFLFIAAFALAHGSLSAQEKAAAPAGELAPLVVTAPGVGSPNPSQPHHETSPPSKFGSFAGPPAPWPRLSPACPPSSSRKRRWATLPPTCADSRATTTSSSWTASASTTPPCAPGRTSTGARLSC